VARANGFNRVVLLGYSMGGTVCTNFIANHDAPEVLGLLTIAHPASLPEALRLRWERYGATPSYEEVADYARPIVAAAAGNDDVLLHVVTQADHVFPGCVDVVSDMAAAWLANLA